MVKSFRGRSLASSVRSSQEDSAPVLDPKTDSYAKVIETRGKGQFLVSLPTTAEQVLVYMPPKFRNALWIRRGSFIIIRMYCDEQNSSSSSKSNELLHVLSGEQIKEIKREGGWPEEFKTDFGHVEEESESDQSEQSESEEYEY